MRRLLAELRRRNVIRVLIAYVAASWLILQAGDMLTDAFEIPPTVMRVVFTLLLLGLVPTTLVAWLYELTPDGLKRESEIPPAERVTHLSGRRLDYLLIAVLGAVVLVLLAGRLLPSTPRVDPAPRAALAEASQAAPSAATADRAPDANAPPPTSIAVLPFVDLSPSQDQDYLSDGLSEELIGLLATVPQLHVVGRTSAFSFRGKPDDLRSIGRNLGVATVLEGSVRRAEGRLRIGAQLVDTASGYQLWSASYDRQLTDVFDLQEEIAQAVVAALKVELLPDQAPPSADHRTASTEAYTEYLLGRKFAERGTEESVAQAIAALERAIALDPAYAAAHAALSTMQVYAVDYAHDEATMTDHGQRAVAAAERAIELDPRLALGYYARAGVRQSLVWDFAGAQADVRQALALDPANSRVQRQYAILMANLGDFPAAISAARKATANEPLSAASWNLLGYFQLLHGEREAGLAAMQRALEINPERVATIYAMGEIELMLGDPRAALQRAQRLEDDDVFRAVLVATAQHELGDAAASQRALDALIADHAHHSAFQIAEVYAWRGDSDAAFEWLERAYVQHDGGLQTIRYDPLLAKLRGDRRFAALIERMGLTLR